MKRTRDFIEMTFVWKDKRKKKTICFLEIKETRLINQFADTEEVECVEIRVKQHFGTREEFDEINFG